jgi:hypothetical protein
MAGVAVAGCGLQQLYRANQDEFLKYLELDGMSNRVQTCITYGGRFGLRGRWYSGSSVLCSWSPRFGSNRAKPGASAARCKFSFRSPSGPGSSA